MNEIKEQPIRVVILSPYPFVRAGLRLLLDNQEDMQVVGESGDLMESVAIIASQKPAIILLESPSESDMARDFVTTLVKAWDQSRIILLTGKDDTKKYLKAVQEGAIGVVFRAQPVDVLLKAIRKVNAGEVWIERSMVADLLTSLSRSRIGLSTDPEAESIARLSHREKQVIQLIGKGLKNQQIATQLCISESTVRRHLTSIYSKLGVSDRLELLIFANRKGLVTCSTY
jgi:two-component system nitrate/nitrite response regulator NarL